MHLQSLEKAAVPKADLDIQGPPLQVDGDDARPGKQNKTPKCLFSTTQARGRKRGGLNSYHQSPGNVER
jgi:hypothetical protein